jgi:RimJ/RimL family protein N-acetyltransferase
MRVEPVTLEGEVVRLEPLGEHHVEGLVEAAGGDRSTFALTWVPQPTRESCAAYVRSALGALAAGTALPFATVRRADGAVVGSTRFLNIESWPLPAEIDPPRWSVGRRGPEAVEIGSTWLSASSQRSAVNTEAKLLMLAHAFEVWEVLRVSFKTDARNVRSRANIERVGARFEGILRNHMYAYDGGIRDSALYAITPEDWLEVKSALAARLR